MSIKIYDGYKLPLLSITDLHKFLLRWRDEMQPIKDELYLRCGAELAVELFDRTQKYTAREVEEYDLRNGRIRPLYSSEEYIVKMHKKIKLTGQREPQFDFGCELCLIPTNDSILAIIYTEQSSYKTCWESQPGVISYSYYNNCDPPEGITRSQWKLREKEWMTALEDKHPGGVGLNFDPICERFPSSLQDAGPYIPSKSQRAKVLGENSACEEWMKSKEIKELTIPLFMEFKQWSKNEGKSIFDKTCQEIENNLCDLTIDKLIEPIPIAIV